MTTQLVRRLHRLLLTASIPLIVLGSTLAGVDIAAADYRIGTDDVLAISVWDNKDLDQVVFVRPDGNISLPLVGEVPAGGRTVAELEQELIALYRRTIREAIVTVSVREIRSRAIFFLGAVAKPGPLQLTQDLTLLQALSAAGGLGPTAALESAFVLRGNERLAVDLVRLIHRADMTQNIKLEPGDTIVVPAAGKVFVQGEVRTPGALPFSRDLTLLKAIAQSGGFTPGAATRRVTIITENGDKKVTVRVNINEIIAQPDENNDVMLKPNDIVIVPQRLF